MTLVEAENELQLTTKQYAASRKKIHILQGGGPGTEIEGKPTYFRVTWCGKKLEDHPGLFLSDMPAVLCKGSGVLVDSMCDQCVKRKRKWEKDHLQ